MENKFTPEELWDYLVKKYSSLNDDNAKAKQVYDTILAAYTKK